MKYPVVFEGSCAEIAGDALYGERVYLCAMFLNLNFPTHLVPNELLHHRRNMEYKENT